MITFYKKQTTFNSNMTINNFNLLIFFVFGAILLHSCKQGATLEQGINITKSVKIKKDSFLITSDSINGPAMIITGHDIIINFNGATIIGDTNYQRPDLFTGLGIKVENASNVTIRNLNIRGFKVGLLADSVPGLTIENCDFSYNYRPRMKSIREREDISDWLSYHDNEADEWLRYGAGIYLKNCDKTVVRDNTITQNQNAILMTGCNLGNVYNNVFTFNSGLGIGLYRSTQNKIMHNCLDFNIRGYSHGFYRRGQDSAGALFYEQSSDNVFAYNSATHSGDGFFLWAGNETMDSGEGGCNNNVIAYNDFSYAPTNGIEVTFSSNIIIGNKMVDCRYGIWGGYSYDTYIADNYFERNHHGVAIEHGNNNTIVDNEFIGDSIGIQLWERETQPEGWGFAQKRDVSSREYKLGGNTFVGVKNISDIRNTNAIESTFTQRNHYEIPKQVTDGLNAIDLIQLEGRDKILVNEWGPYNYSYPLLWLKDIRQDTLMLAVLGPEGRWQLNNMKGFVSISSEEGTIGDTIHVIRDLSIDEMKIDLIYSGSTFIDQMGVTRKGQDYLFYFYRYDKPINWDVKWYTYKDENDPLDNYILFKNLSKRKPDHQEKTKDLAYRWWRSPGGNVHPDRFGTFAEATVSFDPGDYLIQITSDDGVKLFIDDELKLDHWDIHVPATDSINVQLSGKHTFRIEHFEGGGFSTLDFKINPIK